MPAAASDADLPRRLTETADLVTVALDALLPRADGPEARLMEAMRYVALGPGVRLRPFFALETARMFDAPDRPVLRAACALECVHAASVLQGDLPWLDDVSYREGRPALHSAYDQTTALLAGCALQAAGFEIMAHRDTCEDATVRAELVRRLAVAGGAKGIAGGYMIDRVGAGSDLGGVARMQRMKTGALIALAFDVGLTLAGRSEGSERTALMGFAQDLSLALKIAEGLRIRGLGEGGRRGDGADLVALIGPQAARERLAMLAAQCRSHLDIFGERARYLRDSVDFVLDRRA